VVRRRRLQAADLFAQSRTRTQVASELGVLAQTSDCWYARWRDGGVAEHQIAIWCSQKKCLSCSVNDAVNVLPCSTCAYLNGGPVLTCSTFTRRR
jgi:Homeodomain-like domain